MSLSTKREFYHDPWEIEPRKRRSSKFNRKHPGSHSRKSSKSIDGELLKIGKSSSSTENPKLKILYSPNKGIPKVIKTHKDSEDKLKMAEVSQNLSIAVTRIS
jgi:hypothetical protein